MPIRASLNDYIEASALMYIVKQAVLTDSEYMSVLNDYKLREILDRYGLLDKFYLSMPDKPLKFLEKDKADRLTSGIEQNTFTRIKPTKEQFVKLKNFTKEYGDSKIDPIIINSRFGTAGIEVGIDVDKSIFDKSINSVLVPYYNKVGYTKNLDKFIDNYIEYQTKGVIGKSANQIAMIYASIIDNFLSMLSQNSAKSDVQLSTDNNIDTAINLRKSDDFDVVKQYIPKTDNNDIYEEIARIPRVERTNSSSGAKPEVPVIKYDTSEDSTKKG